MKKSDYKIKSNSKKTVFWVCDEYNMYGNYYKTRRGAEKKLKEVRFAAGEIQG